jgi:hypothetical protein
MAIVGSSDDFTPTWGAASGTNSIGNGTITATYRQDYKWVDGVIQITMGSTTSYASGAWSLTLPVTARYTGLVFDGAIRDNSASKTYPMFAELVPTSKTTLSLRLMNTTAGNEFIAVNGGGSNPVTFGTGDTVTVWFRYEAA